MQQRTAAAALASGRLTYRERTFLLQFLTHACNSYEHVTIRKMVLQVVSTPMWLRLPAEELQLVQQQSKQLRKHVKQVKKFYENAGLTNSLSPLQKHARDFLPALYRNFLKQIEVVQVVGSRGYVPPWFMPVVERM